MSEIQLSHPLPHPNLKCSLVSPILSAALVVFSLFTAVLTSFNWRDRSSFSFTHSSYCHHIKIYQLLVFVIKSIIFHWCCQSLKMGGPTCSLSDVMISSTLSFLCMAASSLCTFLSVSLSSNIRCQVESPRSSGSPAWHHSHHMRRLFFIASYIF